ncbi:hypothetical protein Tco_0863037 [Tanacetum coccineum]
MKKAFQDMLHGLGEVNPTHAYYNGSCTSKDTEDPSWSTSFKTRSTQKTSLALEALWKTLFVLYLYLIGTLIPSDESKVASSRLAFAISLTATSDATCPTSAVTRGNPTQPIDLLTSLDDVSCGSHFLARQWRLAADDCTRLQRWKVGWPIGV